MHRREGVHQRQQGMERKLRNKWGTWGPPSVGPLRSGPLRTETDPELKGYLELFSKAWASK